MEIRFAQAGGAMHFLDAGQAVELHHIAEAIPKRAAQQTREPARHCLVDRGRDGARLHDMAFLLAVLDGSWARRAHALDGLTGRCAQFNQQAGGDRA